MLMFVIDLEFGSLSTQNENSIQFHDNIQVNPELRAVVKQISQCQPQGHLEITDITKIPHQDERITFFKNTFGQNYRGLFHGTNSESIKNIIHSGFKTPDKAKMLGKGIYFASDLVKCTSYCQGSRTILYCWVHEGKRLEVIKPDHTLDIKKMKLLNYDSVYARAGSFKTGKVNYLSFDEIVIYDPIQVVPIFKIEFRYWL